MSEKRFICKRGWKRHSQDTIITEWEWKRLPQEIQERHFEEYKPEPEVIPESVNLFENELKEKLGKAGIKAEFKHKVKAGIPEVEANFKFNENEDNI